MIAPDLDIYNRRLADVFAELLSSELQAPLDDPRVVKLANTLLDGAREHARARTGDASGIMP